MSVDELADELGNLGIIDAIELVKTLERRWGVSATRRIGNFVSNIIEEQVREEQTEFDVILESCGLRKLEVIKIARQVYSNMGLKEAKDFVETPQVKFIEAVGKVRAEDIARRLTDVGATVKII